jgi:acyl carrier protein
MPDARSRLRALVESVAQRPPPADDEESLFESGILNSIALLDVVSAIEDEFKIKVPDDDIHPRKFDSIARMEAYLSDHGA